MGLFKNKTKEVEETVVVEELTPEELEGIQTTFNTDGFDELNEDGEVENVY